MAKSYYQSPDLFTIGRTNFYRQIQSLCGPFIGYIQETKEGQYICCPVDRKPLKFNDPDIGVRYIFGTIHMPEIIGITPGTVTEHAKIINQQLTIF